MSHDEIAELLGAYALDAVDADEAAAVSAHVEDCPRCAAELSEYHEVAGMLASVGGDAPGELWDRIAAQATRPTDATPNRSPLSEPAPLVAIDGVAARRSARNQLRARRVTTAVAGVAAVLAVVLGLQVAHLDTKVNNLSALSERQGMSQAVQAALLDPSARRITLAGTSSSAPALAELVVLPSGSAYLVNSRLAPLPAGQTYQLWGVVGGRAISLGLLGSRPATVPFTVDTSATVTAYAVTAERAGGVVVTTHAPVATSHTLTA